MPLPENAADICSHAGVFGNGVPDRICLCRSVGLSLRKKEHVECIEFVHVVLFENHLDQFIHQNKGQDHARNGNDDSFRKILDHGKYAAIPALRGLSYLICHIRNLIVDGVENAGVLSGDRIDQALFNPVCYPFKQTAHKSALNRTGRKAAESALHQPERYLRLP